MEVVKFALLWAIQIYMYILIGRILVEMIVSFSRNFTAPSWFTRFAETLFVLTDPPVKALRSIIPPLRMNNVALDLSVLVLYFGLVLLQYVINVVL
ncbi:MAG: YggT family protein [Corynebacterium sp.]|uniref:YggT family protein n=1 Tax=Corynebacterium sp. TaxID=1720 RepID=UPI0026DAE521|nr:YggT family protein [Corynebacterium sp.]MDO5097930.1 YggT family protein [Corynebacterium sp.]